ncbi:MAG: LOW QUALITY PROTEIN: hypothetical protein KVP17_000006 [Porospora cf. gigantea B]|uniref:uncharacterized protein n=1 Tax=Porospora cf. gigantea B TaxID=2853592 RepID=UPI0035718163|nr:MAG: LOW QUALITY PROTEIN: hypothetical protein KVP17_000006 [Porospora cf. gigantea B]
MGRHLLSLEVSSCGVLDAASTFHVDLLKGRLAEHKTVAGFQVRSAAGLVTTRTLTLDFSVLSQDEPLPAASPAAATHNKRRFSVSSAPPPIAEVYDRVGPLAPFVEVFVVRIEGRNVHRDSRDRLQLWLNSVPACNELLVVMAHSHATSRKDTEKARKEMLVDCEGRHRIRDRILHLVLDADSHKDSQELWGAFGARLRDCLQVNIEQRLELLQLSLLHECRTYRVNHRWAVRLLNCLSTFTPIASCLETVENDRVTSLASNFERHCLLLQWVDAFACLSSQLGFVWESVLIKMLMAPGLPADDITLCQVGPPPTQPDAMCAVWKQLRSDESDPADFSFPPSRAGLLTLADSVLDVTQPVTPVANYFQWRLLTHWKATCELGKPCSDGVVSAPLFKEALPAKQHAGRLLYLAEARLSFLAGLELDLQSTDPPEEAYYLFIVLKVVLLLDAVHTIQDRLLAYREQDQDDGTSGRPAPPATMLSGHSLTLETTRETSRHAKSAEKVRGTRVYSLAVCRCLSACIQSWSQLEHLRSPTPPENSVEIRPPRTKCTLEEALSLSQDPTSRTKFLEFLRTQLKLYADHANLCRTSHMLLLQYGVSCPSTPVVKPGQGWERVQRVESRKAQKSEGASDRLKLALLTEIAHERRDPSDLPPELKHEWKVDLDAVVEWYAEPMDVLDEKDVGLAPQTPVPCDKGTRTVRFIGSKDTDSVIAGFHSGCVPAFSPLLSELQHRLIKRARVPYALYKAERVQDADVYLPAESCGEGAAKLGCRPLYDWS